MEGGSSEYINKSPEVRRAPSVPMKIVGGNSSLDEAQVVFLGTQNHYNAGYQARIARSLQILPQAGDVVLTEGESFGGALGSSRIPEMAKVDTGQVTMMGWEDSGLYDRATSLVRDLEYNIALYNYLGGMSLNQMAKPFIDKLKNRINKGMSDFDRVVLNERTSAMKKSIMSVVGKRLEEDGTVFVYAGAAHLTSSQLGGMGGVKHVVLGV